MSISKIATKLWSEKAKKLPPYVLKKLSAQIDNINNQAKNKRDDLRFFLKCYNTETERKKTYHFDNQDDLADFAEKASEQGLIIIDTHITFFDIELLFAPISDEDAVITAMDIDMAEDGNLCMQQWDSEE